MNTDKAINKHKTKLIKLLACEKIIPNIKKIQPKNNGLFKVNHFQIIFLIFRKQIA